MSSLRVLDTSALAAKDLCFELKKRNVDTRPVFPAISQYPYWVTKTIARPNSALLGESAINLPSGVCLKKNQVDYVCQQINQLTGGK